LTIPATVASAERFLVSLIL